MQHAFDVVGVVALLEQRERDASRPATRRRDGRFRELRLGPLRVRGLHVVGEPAQVARVDRRHVAPHRDHVGVRVFAREVELLEPPERAHDRRARAFALAEAEGRRRVGQGKLDAVGTAVEAVGEVAEEEERSGPEGREPERLGVAGAGVVAEGVDDRVGPGLDGERGRHGFSRRGRRGGSAAGTLIWGKSGIGPAAAPSGHR